MRAASLALTLSIGGAVASIVDGSALAVRAQSAGATVTGRVLADETGDPIPNARVAIPSPTSLGTPVTLTDDAGRFTLRAAPDATRIVASKSGFGRRELTISGATPLEIRLVRGAAVSGRVVDEFGDPIQGARVTAFAVDAAPDPRAAPRTPPAPRPLPPGQAGPAPLAPPPPGPGGSRPVDAAIADTDDRGEYRLARRDACSTSAAIRCRARPCS